MPSCVPVSAAVTKIRGNGVATKIGALVESRRCTLGCKSRPRPKSPIADANNAKRHLLAKVALAERTGLEPAASGVTGRRYNQLNYRSSFQGS